MSYPPQFSSNDEVPTLCSGPFSSEVISGTEGASIEILRRSNSNYDHVDEFWYAFALSSPIPNLQDPPGPALSDNGSSSSSSDGSTPKSDSGLNTESTTPASSPAASRTSLSPRDETLDTPASPPVALGADLPPRDETLATPDDSPYIPLDLTRYALEQYQAAENATANAPEYTFRKTAERNPSPEGKSIRGRRCEEEPGKEEDKGRGQKMNNRQKAVTSPNPKISSSTRNREAQKLWAINTP
ncbi:hypothetical protein TWF217_003492 [Orbilia oligospora]|nr:hypothetical protein TWF217_003492 [Orbilia oligospora]